MYDCINDKKLMDIYIYIYGALGLEPSIHFVFKLSYLLGFNSFHPFLNPHAIPNHYSCTLLSRNHPLVKPY